MVLKSSVFWDGRKVRAGSLLCMIGSKASQPFLDADKRFSE